MSDLPDDTDRVQVLYDRVTMRVDSELVPDDIHSRELRHGRGDKVMDYFTEGDEMPVELAEQWWSAFNDRFAAPDADGDRLDSPSHTERVGFDTALFHHR